MQFKNDLENRECVRYLYPKLSEEEIQESIIEPNSEDANFNKQFYWYTLVYIASGENFLKIDEVMNKPIVELLTFMNYYKRKSQLNADSIRRANLRTSSKY